MRTIFALAVLAAAIGIATPTLAENNPACGAMPREQWMSEAAIKAKATELGYQVRKVTIEDNCYEVYGVDDKGGKVEIYFNPVTGAVAKTKSKN